MAATDVGDLRYTNSDGVHVAYRVGRGTGVDLLCYPGAPLLPMESVDDEPRYARFQRRLASFCRLIQFDARGVGLSDPTSPDEPPTLEQWVGDAVAVLDAVGVEQVALFAPRDATLEAVMLAAAHPGRVSRLVIVNGSQGCGATVTIRSASPTSYWIGS